jgi:hypothetical protein
MDETKCFKGWGDTESNPKGKCCCNCKNQVSIRKHPWNKSKFAEGNITEQIGFGCASSEFSPNVIFFDTEHSMCELYQSKFDDPWEERELRKKFEEWYETTKHDKHAKWHEDEKRYTALSMKQNFWESWKASFEA